MLQLWVIISIIKSEESRYSKIDIDNRKSLLMKRKIAELGFISSSGLPELYNKEQIFTQQNQTTPLRKRHKFETAKVKSISPSESLFWAKDGILIIIIDPAVAFSTRHLSLRLHVWIGFICQDTMVLDPEPHGGQGHTHEVNKAQRWLKESATAACVWERPIIKILWIIA